MEFVILGFLLIRSLSQYDLLKALSKDVSPFYQPSLGSIQNALKKLLAKGLITKKIVHDTRRKKNLYTITENGRLSYYTNKLHTNKESILMLHPAFGNHKIFKLNLSIVP